MNATGRQRSLRLQLHQQQSHQQHFYPALPLGTFGSVRLKPEPIFVVDMDDDDKGGVIQHLTPPRQRAMRTHIRGYMDKVDIGPDHQADVLDFENGQEYGVDSEVETLVWAPSGAISKTQLNQYITVATSTNNYSVEPAITMLQAHSHDCVSALEQVSRYANTKSLWATTERQRFELLLCRHGTRFERIKQAMPWRSLAELLDFYYAWGPTQRELSYPQQLLAWQDMALPKSQHRVSGNTLTSKVKFPVLPSPLLPQAEQQAPTPPLRNVELLALVLDNISAWQCADFMRKVRLLQAQLLVQRAQLENKTCTWLEDWDELRRAIKLGGSRIIREWRTQDKQLLVCALDEHGCNFKLIARIVRSKTEQQVRQYYEKNKGELLQFVMVIDQSWKLQNFPDCADDVECRSNSPNNIDDEVEIFASQKRSCI